MDFVKMISETREKRNGVHAKMLELVSRAGEEKRNLTAEEDEQYSRMENDFRAQSEELRRLESLEKQERELSKSAGTKAGAQILPGENRENAKPYETEEYRSAFGEYIRKKDTSAIRSLIAGENSKGGYMVPLGFENKLLEKLQELNIMRQICDVQNLGFGETNIPIATDYGAATWLDEEEDYAESDATFGQAVLKAKKLGRISKVSEELLQDAAFDVESVLIKGFGISFAKAEEQAFISGAGTKDAKGFLLDVNKIKTSSAAGSITYDDIVDVMFNVKPAYRKIGIWLVSDGSVKQLLKLKDGDGRPLWQPSIQVGQPDILLGRPVYYSPEMPDFASGKKPLAYGDFKQYRIADRSGMFVQRLNELYATKGQIGFRGRRRLDGKLLISEAIAALAVQ